MADKERTPRQRARMLSVSWLTCAVFLCSITATCDARADGVDVAWYLTRVPGWHRAPVRAALLVVVLMTANYALNLLVVGLPSVKMGASLPRVAKDLVTFTLLGQVADRLGAVVGPLVCGLVVMLFKVSGEAGIALVLILGIGLNFLLSGLAIGLLVRHYMCRRWSLSGRRVRAVALTAALLTNPTWAIGAGALLANLDNKWERPDPHLHNGSQRSQPGAAAPKPTCDPTVESCR